MRMSVIFKSDGIEFRLTFWGYASRSAKRPSPATAAPVPRSERRPIASSSLDICSPFRQQELLVVWNLSSHKVSEILSRSTCSPAPKFNPTRTASPARLRWCQQWPLDLEAAFHSLAPISRAPSPAPPRVHTRIGAVSLPGPASAAGANEGRPVLVDVVSGCAWVQKNLKLASWSWSRNASSSFENGELVGCAGGGAGRRVRLCGSSREFQLSVGTTRLARARALIHSRRDCLRLGMPLRALLLLCFSCISTNYRASPNQEKPRRQGQTTKEVVLMACPNRV